MAFDDRERRRLGELLTEHLGDEGCELLMAQLPPQGWDELATKSDIALLKTELMMVETRLQTQITGEIGSLRTELKDEITAARLETSNLRTELTNEITAARLETERIRTELWRVTISIIGAVAALLAVFEFALR